MTIPPRAKRHTLYYLRVFDGRSGAFLGHLSDISTEGISLLSDAPLPCPATYLLRILVPRPGAPESPLELEVESRWSGQEDGTCTTGFRICAPSEEQRRRIEAAVQNFGYARIGDTRRSPGPGTVRPGSGNP